MRGLKYILGFGLILIISNNSFAQNKFTISGVVKDAQTGETLIGASVKIQEIPTSGTISNAYGFYSLTEVPGFYHLLINYIGYQAVSFPLDLNQNIILNPELKSGTQLDEITISSKAQNEQITQPQMGIQRLNMHSIKDIPVIFGEKDVLKTIQLLPGIKSGGEGGSGFYVRGGGSDQNLIQLDEAVVYNAYHLLGFFSTFNSDAIKDVSIYKGGMPAEYGGRLSSVIDIKMNDGNNKDYTVEGGLGLISSRLKIEGPMTKHKGSFMISARRTYADLFLKLSKDSTLRNNTLYFYDMNVKANYQINEKNTIYLSAYMGKDVLVLGNTFDTNWGNKTATFRWNHLFNNKLFSNSTLIYSDYNYTIKSSDDINNFRVISNIRDLNLKQDYQYFANDKHSLKFGLNVIYHTINPGKITTTDTSRTNNKSPEKRFGTEIAVYVSDEWHPGDRMNIIYGLRFNSFAMLGPGTFNTYDSEGRTIGSDKHSSGQIVKTYFYPEPRISASYRLGSLSSLKASYTRNTQNLHLLSNSTTSLPTDTWIMSSNNVKAEIADQASLGYYRNFKNDLFEFSAEVYYKNMQNQIDYKNAAKLEGNTDVESQLLFGRGRAYGIELFLKKRSGNFNGWIGYTLSRTERKFDGINDGNYFPAKQDCTHDISAVAIYEINGRLTLSSTFVFNTGNAVTFPSGKYSLQGQTTYYYTERNGYRMSAYNRLDLGATLKGKKHTKYVSSWTFGVYNSYNRKNAYFIKFQDDPHNHGHTQAVQITLFGIIPSVTWNFKFF